MEAKKTKAHGRGEGMRGRSRADGLPLRAGLPEDALGDSARVTMTGRTSALVEGQHGVVELSAARIRLKTGEGVLSVTGEALRLEELSLDAAMIRAQRIDAVSYGGIER